MRISAIILLFVLLALSGCASNSVDGVRRWYYWHGRVFTPRPADPVLEKMCEDYRAAVVKYESYDGRISKSNPDELDADWKRMVNLEWEIQEYILPNSKR